MNIVVVVVYKCVSVCEQAHTSECVTGTELMPALTAVHERAVMTQANTTLHPNSLRHSQHLLSSLRGSTDTNDFRSSLPPPLFAEPHMCASLFDSFSFPEYIPVRKKRNCLKINEKATLLSGGLTSYLIAHLMKNDAQEDTELLNEAAH